MRAVNQEKKYSLCQKILDAFKTESVSKNKQPFQITHARRNELFLRSKRIKTSDEELLYMKGFLVEELKSELITLNNSKMHNNPESIKKILEKYAFNYQDIITYNEYKYKTKTYYTESGDQLVAGSISDYFETQKHWSSEQSHPLESSFTQFLEPLIQRVNDSIVARRDADVHCYNADCFFEQKQSVPALNCYIKAAELYLSCEGSFDEKVYKNLSVILNANVGLTKKQVVTIIKALPTGQNQLFLLKQCANRETPLGAICWSVNTFSFSCHLGNSDTLKVIAELLGDYKEGPEIIDAWLSMNCSENKPGIGTLFELKNISDSQSEDQEEAWVIIPPSGQ